MRPVLVLKPLTQFSFTSTRPNSAPRYWPRVDVGYWLSTAPTTGAISRDRLRPDPCAGLTDHHRPGDLQGPLRETERRRGRHPPGRQSKMATSDSSRPVQEPTSGGAGVSGSVRCGGALPTWVQSIAPKGSGLPGFGLVRHGDIDIRLPCDCVRNPFCLPWADLAGDVTVRSEGLNPDLPRLLRVGRRNGILP